MLAGHVAACDAVICLVGFAYGCEPHDRPPGEPQRSYTQLEYHVARELGKPVYSFLSDDVAHPCDAPPAEDDRKRRLQLDHRAAIRARDDLYHTFASKGALELAVAKIPVVERSGLEISGGRLRHHAEDLVGREGELARLDAAWADPETNVVTIVAWGGVGKTALVATWMARLAADRWRGAQRVLDWSFYSQGTRERGTASADLFFDVALRFFGDPDPTRGSPWDKGDRLARLVARHRTLLVLDGVEPLQHAPGPLAGRLTDPALAALLKNLAQHNPGLCLVTTREPVVDLAALRQTTAPEWDLEHLSDQSGAALLHRLGANRAGKALLLPDDPELLAASRDARGHALTLHLLGRFLAKAHHGDVRRRDLVELHKADATIQGSHASRVMAAYAR